MWLFLWVIIVLGAIGFFLWSYHTTFEQKKAWKAYALKFGLAYVGGALLQPPEMTGEVKNHRVNCYAQAVPDPQGKTRTETVVEVFLNIVPPVPFVVVKPGFADFLVSINLPKSFVIDDPDWPKAALAQTLEEEQPELWFQNNKKKISALGRFFKLPFDTGVIADGDQAFLVIRTPDPLNDPRKLNQLVNKMIMLADEIGNSPIGDQPTMASPNDDKNTVEPEISAPKE